MIKQRGERVFSPRTLVPRVLSSHLDTVTVVLCSLLVCFDSVHFTGGLLVVSVLVLGVAGFNNVCYDNVNTVFPLRHPYHRGSVALATAFSTTDSNSQHCPTRSATWAIVFTSSAGDCCSFFRVQCRGRSSFLSRFYFVFGIPLLPRSLAIGNTTGNDADSDFPHHRRGLCTDNPPVFFSWFGSGPRPTIFCCCMNWLVPQFPGARPQYNQNVNELGPYPVGNGLSKHKQL